MLMGQFVSNAEKYKRSNVVDMHISIPTATVVVDHIYIYS